jgi:hypothetical protein
MVEQILCDADRAVLAALVPRRIEDGYWRAVGPGAIVYPNLALNDAAALLFQLCDGSRSVVDILEAMITTYVGTAPETIARDALHAIFRLADSGAVTFVRAGG